MAAWAGRRRGRWNGPSSDRISCTITTRNLARRPRARKSNAARTSSSHGVFETYGVDADAQASPDVSPHMVSRVLPAARSLAGKPPAFAEALAGHRSLARRRPRPPRYLAG